MQTSVASTRCSEHRCLVVLPVAVERADRPRVDRRLFSGLDHRPKSAEAWRTLATDTRYLPDGPWSHRCEGAHYGSDGHGASWLLLAGGHSEAKTLDLTWQAGTRYRLSLACAEVFGCPDQRLTVALTGGASARATFAIPASRSGHERADFILCTLHFTPVSEAAITVRLTNPVVMASTPAVPARSCLRV